MTLRELIRDLQLLQEQEGAPDTAEVYFAISPGTKMMLLSLYYVGDRDSNEKDIVWFDIGI